jgi:hypothetical protein
MRLGIELLDCRDLLTFGSVAFPIYGPLPLDPAPVEIAPPTSNPTSSHTNIDQGSITAEVIDGVLVIRGDGGNNYVEIYSSIGDTYVINAGWTKVNGQYLKGTELNERYLFLSGVTNGFDIDLGDGDDYLLIHADRVPSLTIRLGAGDDRLLLKGAVPAPMYVTGVYHPYPMLTGPIIASYMPAQPLMVEGELFIDTGAGDDLLDAFAKIEGNATVQMGDGDDSYLESANRIYPVFEMLDPETGYYPPGLYVIGKLTATGELSIDLGADQDVENIPDDYRTDAYLVEKLQLIPKVLEHYAGIVERGENTPGVVQLVTLPWPNDFPMRFDEEGRLEIYFQFLPGFSREIERLQARGVTLDAYSIMRGFARASITADDLKLFANLPGIFNFFVQIYANPGYRSLIHPEWDYVRPGSAAAAENPPGPVEGNIVGPDYVPPGFIPPGKLIFPITHPLPIFGPPPFEDLPRPGSEEPESLLDSREGKRSRAKQGTIIIFGPQPIQ